MSMRLSAALLLLIILPLFPLHAQKAQQPSQQKFTLDINFLAVRSASDSRDGRGLIAQVGREQRLDRQVLLGLGCLQDDQTIQIVFNAFSDPSPEMRALAAWTLGQILREARSGIASQEWVLETFDVEKDPLVRAAFVNAIAQFGDRAALNRIAEMQDTDPVACAGKALAIARFAYRGIRSDTATRAAAELYTSNRVGIADGMNPAIYALMRIGDSTLLAPHASTLLDAVRSTDPNVRMHAIAALGKIHTDTAVVTALSLLNDPDWRVRVNAIRCFGKVSPSPQVGKHMLAAILDELAKPSYHTVKTVLQTIPDVRFSHTKLGLALKKMVDTASSVDLRQEAIRALASASPDLAMIEMQVWRSMKKPLPAMIEAAGIVCEKRREIDPALKSWVEQCMSGPEASSVAPAVLAWQKMWAVARETGQVKPLTEEDHAWEQRLLLILDGYTNPGRRNPSAVQAATDALTDPRFIRMEYGVSLLEALLHMRPDGDIETTIALLKAIGTTGDKSIPHALRPLLSDENALVRRTAYDIMVKAEIRNLPDPGLFMPLAQQPSGLASAAVLDTAAIRKIHRNPVADIVTSRGRIRIELFVEDALYTVNAFMGLAKKGFYDGLTFHRVVPNFVIQGGDPNGDGTGGPPFTLRSEFSTQTFERGIVGMASSGKDTEGSQFFIMHSSHPHLDGRYTPFGRVIEGMDVVDRIEVGDTITSVTIQL